MTHAAHEQSKPLLHRMQLVHKVKQLPANNSPGLSNKATLLLLVVVAGGTMMDAGCYCAHALRFFPGLQPSVQSAAAQGVLHGFIDQEMVASVKYPDCDVVGTLQANLKYKGMWPVTHFQAVGTR